MLAKGPELVIFDLDGVLIDSEALSCRAFVEVLPDYGMSCSFEQAVERFVGVHLSEIFDELAVEYGEPLPKAFHEDLDARVDWLFANELSAIAGAEAMLSSLGHASCLASNSAPDYIDRTLSQVGLDTHLPASRRFSASMVANPKPAPDVFLHAAETCGVAPADCIVVEDSEAGARAARAAGMTVLGFLGGGHIADPDGHASRLRAVGVQAVFDNHDSLPALLTAI